MLALRFDDVAPFKSGRRTVVYLEDLSWQGIPFFIAQSVQSVQSPVYLRITEFKRVQLQDDLAQNLPSTGYASIEAYAKSWDRVNKVRFKDNPTVLKITCTVSNAYAFDLETTFRNCMDEIRWQCDREFVAAIDAALSGSDTVSP